MTNVAGQRVAVAARELEGAIEGTLAATGREGELRLGNATLESTTSASMHDLASSVHENSGFEDSGSDCSTSTRSLLCHFRR